jgi:hypothetical protein
MTKQLPIRFLLYMLLLALTAGCEKIPHIVEDRSDVGALTNDGIASAPVFIVGLIAAYKEIGPPKPSRYDKRTPMQLCRITVRLENVLRGDIGSANVPIYYLVNFGSNGGPSRLGIIVFGSSEDWRRRKLRKSEKPRKRS